MTFSDLRQAHPLHHPSLPAISPKVRAGIAQLVEQLICNQKVGGSSPSVGAIQPEVTASMALM